MDILVLDVWDIIVNEHLRGSLRDVVALVQTCRAGRLAGHCLRYYVECLSENAIECLPHLVNGAWPFLKVGFVHFGSNTNEAIVQAAVARRMGIAVRAGAKEHIFQNQFMEEVAALAVSGTRCKPAERECPLTERDIKCFRSLREIRLKFCPEMHHLPYNFGILKQLTKLRLSECGLSGLPPSFASLISLTTLIVQHCHHLMTLPTEICELPALEQLQLSDLPLLHDLPPGLGSLPRLTTLNVSRLPINSLPSSLESCNTLVHLTVTSCARMQPTIGWLSKSNTVETVVLSNIAVHVLPSHIAQYSMLTRLEVHCFLQLETLPESFGQLSSLEVLSLTTCPQLRQLPSTVETMTALKTVMLNGCISLESLPDSMSRLPALETLDLSYCARFKGLPELIGNLKTLVDLRMSFCTSMETLPVSLAKLFKLQHLDLSYCENLQALPFQPEALPNTRIDTRFCPHLSPFWGDIAGEW